MLSLLQRHYKLKDGTSTWAYQIRGTDRWTGKPLRKGTRTRDRKVAERKLYQLEEQLKSEASGKVEHNFAAAVAEYAAKKGEERRHMDLLLDYFGTKMLSEIEDTDVSKFADLHYPKAKASTLVRQVYGPMQWIWNAAARAHMCSPRTFAKPEIKEQPVKYARNDDWLLAVLRGCTTIPQRCALMFMSFSGARAAEIVRVRICDYSPDRAEIAVRTKGGKERVIPLSSLVNEALQMLDLTRDPQAPLFGYASRFSLTRILKRACRRAKVEYLSPHRAGRHTFAARLLRNGASLKELQSAGGWDSINSVARYSHLERDAVHARIRGVATTIEPTHVTMDGTMANGQTVPLKITKQDQSDTRM